MKSIVKFTCAMITGAMIYSTAAFAAVDEVSPPLVVSTQEETLSERGTMPYCEFVRTAVVETMGQLPPLMDTHYAATYMNKAKELGWIEEIPQEKWNEPIPYEQMQLILSKMNQTDRKKTIEKANQLLIDSIQINGAPLDISSLGSTVRCGNIMIPLRKVAEALGFIVTWDDATYTAMIENEDIRMPFQMGSDLYFKTSVKAIGMSAPVSFGTPIIMKDDRVFVPADVFTIAFSDPQSVRVNDGVLYIGAK